MIYSVDGRIVQVDNRIPERRLTSLTFQTRSDKFPDSTGGSLTFRTDFNIPTQNVRVIYGDGTSSDFLLDRTISFDSSNEHFFEDTENNGTLRNVTVEFERLQDLTDIFIDRVNLAGRLPLEIKSITGLTTFLFRRVPLDTVDTDYSNLKELDILNFDQLGINSFSKPIKIPDWVFSTKLSNFNTDGFFDLSDPSTNNFFKINQLSETLETFNLRSAGVTLIPEEISLMTNLKNLSIAPNNSITNPQAVESMSQLESLGMTLDPNIQQPFDASNLFNVRGVRISLLPIIINSMPTNWVGFKSLKQFNIMQLDLNNTNLDLFIDKFYELCTDQGFLDPLSSEAIATGFPEQFRDVSWGHSTYTQTGTIQAPAGFILGTDNGTPANQGEKIYVLVNNYGHNVTTSGNFN